MPFDFPFFKRESGLLKKKLEHLENAAAETEHSRMEYTKQAKATGELKISKHELENYELRERHNNNEIARRQSELARISGEEHQVRKKMEESLVEAAGQPSKEAKQYSHHLDELDIKKRHHIAEIQRLEEQNSHLNSQIDSLQTPEE